MTSTCSKSLLRVAPGSQQRQALTAHCSYGLERLPTEPLPASLPEWPCRHQLECIKLVADHLTGYGVKKPARLYESPFTGVTAHGPGGLFSSAQVVPCCSQTT